MPQHTDIFDLGRLGLVSGEGRRLDLEVRLEPIELAGQRYTAPPSEARVDVSRTTGGWSLRLRAEVALEGPCMRCLEDAGRGLSIDAREVDQPGDDIELASPYVEEERLDVRAWLRDAVLLALPAQVVCREECRGLCGICGADLNADPEHAHERAPDPRWAKLSELRIE